jgi:hypothetical protein
MKPPSSKVKPALTNKNCKRKELGGNLKKQEDVDGVSKQRIADQ